MFYNTLLLLDGSDVSETVLQYAPGFVSSAGGARITLAMAGEAAETRYPRAYLQHHAANLLNDWPDDGAPIPDVGVALISTKGYGVPHAIIRYASSVDVDVIMMATRGWSGADWWTTGTKAQHIIRESVLPVFVARLWSGKHRRPGKIARLLVPLDGSLPAEQALPYAEHIARTAGAEITLLHVVPEEMRLVAAGPAGAQRRSIEMDAGRYLETIGEGLHQSIRTKQMILTGLPGQQIAQRARDGQYDIIVMFSHGRSGPGGGAFGGIAERVLHGCHAPVLIIPQNARVPEV